MVTNLPKGSLATYAIYYHFVEPLEVVKNDKLLSIYLFASACVSCEISALLLNYCMKGKFPSMAYVCIQSV